MPGTFVPKNIACFQISLGHVVLALPACLRYKSSCAPPVLATAIYWLRDRRKGLGVHQVALSAFGKNRSVVDRCHLPPLFQLVGHAG